MLSIPGEQWNAHSPCVGIFQVLAFKTSIRYEVPIPGGAVWRDLVAGERIYSRWAAEMEVVTERRGCVHDDKEDRICSQGERIYSWRVYSDTISMIVVFVI